VPCQTSASCAERSSDLIAESRPHTPGATKRQPTRREQFWSVPVKLPSATIIRDKPDGDPVPLRRPKPRLARLLQGIVPKLIALAAGVAAGLGLYASLSSTSPPPGGPRTVAQLRVSGNELVSASGQRVVLRGVDRSGTEYECVQGHGIFDGPSGQASVSAMRSRGINAVRVPLNEACWNGQSYVNPAYAGARYRAAIADYVKLLNANGMVAIVDLHWTDGAYTGNASACSSAEATCQKPMPDAAQAVPFWTSVADTFKDNDAVIFDLFNEPYPEQADGGNQTEGWQCWLRGGRACVGIPYRVAGMQTLVNTVRSTGASNVIMLGGLEWSNDLTGWLSHEPADPAHNLAASWHSYNFNACSTRSCWTSQIAPVTAKVPLIAGEIGENDCAHTYISPLMSWLNSKSASYLAWAWNTDFNCASGPGLITSYAGTPTAYGAGYESELQMLAPASTRSHRLLHLHAAQQRREKNALAGSTRLASVIPPRPASAVQSLRRRGRGRPWYEPRPISLATALYADAACGVAW
jgi:Cellulase (glycosyl hydrolase family 5)